MKSLYSIILLIAISITLAVSPVCSKNLSAQQSNISILRLDKELLDYIKQPEQEKGKALLKKYPTLITALAQTINSRADVTQPDKMLEDLSTYFSHPALMAIYTDAVKQFEDMTEYENELSKMRATAEKQLGAKKFPQFAVHVSGLKENVIYINNIISLSIDKYIGNGYSGYKGYFNEFQLQQMQPKMIVRDMGKAWLMADYIKTESTSGDLLSEMIEQGKLLYTLSILLPEYSEQDIVGYTDNDYNWVKENEKKIWNSIVKQKHLYSVDKHIISMYMDESTSQIQKSSTPSRSGIWIGYTIVKQYAKQSKKPLNLLLNTSAQTILKDSGFKS